MTPVGKHGDQVSGNSPFGQKHLEDPAPEDRPQLFHLQGRSDPEHALPVDTVLSLPKEASVRHQDMAVGIISAFYQFCLIPFALAVKGAFRPGL